MEEEKVLTSLQTVQKPGSALVQLMAGESLCFDQESFAESDEIKKNECEQNRKDVGVNTEQTNETKSISTSCQECGKQFKTEFWLKKHLHKHGLKQNYNCELCGKTFKRNSILRAHQREIHSKTKRYSCANCDYATNNKTNFEHHVIVKHLDVNESGIKCENCDSKFFRKADLMRHQIKEHNAPRFKCDSCEKSYTSRQYLLIHQATHKPDFKLEHQCAVCGKLFPSSGRLSGHVRVTHKAQQFSCAECGKSLSSRSMLRDHQTQHSGDKPHLCRICGKTFATAKYLSVHSRTHSDERLYSCQDCEKTFTQRSSFTTHVRRFHVQVKLFCCDVCRKTFATSTLLKNHRKGHKTVIIENHPT